MTGRIKAVTSRGFGWIETKDGIDFFLLYKDFTGDWKKLVLDFLNKKQILVEFESDTNATRGPKAISCRLIGE